MSSPLLLFNESVDDTQQLLSFPKILISVAFPDFQNVLELISQDRCPAVHCYDKSELREFIASAKQKRTAREFLESMYFSGPVSLPDLVWNTQCEKAFGAKEVAACEQYETCKSLLLALPNCLCRRLKESKKLCSPPNDGDDTVCDAIVCDTGYSLRCILSDEVMNLELGKCKSVFCNSTIRTFGAGIQKEVIEILQKFSSSKCKFKLNKLRSGVLLFLADEVNYSNCRGAHSASAFFECVWTNLRNSTHSIGCNKYTMREACSLIRGGLDKAIDTAIDTVLTSEDVSLEYVSELLYYVINDKFANCLLWPICMALGRHKQRNQLIPDEFTDMVNEFNRLDDDMDRFRMTICPKFAMESLHPKIDKDHVTAIKECKDPKGYWKLVDDYLLKVIPEEDRVFIKKKKWRGRRVVEEYVTPDYENLKFTNKWRVYRKVIDMIVASITIPGDQRRDRTRILMSLGHKLMRSLQSNPSAKRDLFVEFYDYVNEHKRLPQTPSWIELSNRNKKFSVSPDSKLQMTDSQQASSSIHASSS